MQFKFKVGYVLPLMIEILSLMSSTHMIQVGPFIEIRARKIIKQIHDMLMIGIIVTPFLPPNIYTYTIFLFSLYYSLIKLCVLRLGIIKRCSKIS